MKKKKLVFEIQELDRRRIARDLHDTSLQNLSHIIHKLELVSKYMDKDMIKAKLELASVSTSINQIIEEIRMVIYDLRPMVFDDLGLRNAVIGLLDKAKRLTAIDVQYEIDEITSVNETFELELYRILQECVINVCKHSQAHFLIVRLKNHCEHVALTVEDDGIGFDPQEARKKENHFGLFILRERVKILSGSIKIDSQPKKGTKIDILIQKH